MSVFGPKRTCSLGACQWPSQFLTLSRPSTCSLGHEFDPLKAGAHVATRDWLRPVRRRQLGECNVSRDLEMSQCLPDLSLAVTANSEKSVPSVTRRRTLGR